jgi:hypothetical protein
MAHADHKGVATARYRRIAYGYDHPRGYEEEHVAFYNSHNRNVRAAAFELGLENCFAELCWEKGDGWNELCSLIGNPIPQKPFPHLNQRRVLAQAK